MVKITKLAVKIHVVSSAYSASWYVGYIISSRTSHDEAKMSHDKVEVLKEKSSSPVMLSAVPSITYLVILLTRLTLSIVSKRSDEH